MRQMAGAAHQVVVHFGRHEHGAAAERLPKILNGSHRAGGDCGVGVTRQMALWNRSARAAASPVFSEPAMDDCRQKRP